METQNQLINTINEDCKLYEKVKNKGISTDDYLYLQVCNNSAENGLYQLILNGYALWYGTLQEINAVVKSMIKLIVEQENYVL